MTLSVTQQHILNYLNLVKVVSSRSMTEFYEEIIHSQNGENASTRNVLSQEILSINRAIRIYDLEIVECFDEITSKKLYILINLADNVISQKSKFYDDNIIRVFSKVVKECVLAKEGRISETECLNLSSQIGVSKTVIETALKKLFADKWLLKKDGSVFLSMRSIVELESTLKQLYPDDIKTCTFCKLVVVQGYNCFNCDSRCHSACLKKFFHKTKSNCVCPRCKQHWNDVSEFLNIRNEIEDVHNVTETTFDTSSVKRKKIS